jgi:hypothetical protein
LVEGPNAFWIDMQTYSVFVSFRKGRLALRRKILSLEEAITCAEAHRAARRDRPEDVFVVVDRTGETLSVAAARAALARHRQMSQFDRLQRAREAAARTTARAIEARERAIVACERARTVADRHPFSSAGGGMFGVDRLIAQTDRAAAVMMRSIVLMEQRLSSVRTVRRTTAEGDASFEPIG